MSDIKEEEEIESNVHKRTGETTEGKIKERGPKPTHFLSHLIPRIGDRELARATLWSQIQEEEGNNFDFRQYTKRCKEAETSALGGLADIAIEAELFPEDGRRDFIMSWKMDKKSPYNGEQKRVCEFAHEIVSSLYEHCVYPNEEFLRKFLGLDNPGMIKNMDADGFHDTLKKLHRYEISLKVDEPVVPESNAYSERNVKLLAIRAQRASEVWRVRALLCTHKVPYDKICEIIAIVSYKGGKVLSEDPCQFVNLPTPNFG